MGIRIQQLSMNPVTTGGIRPGTQANSFKDLFTRANASNLGQSWGAVNASTSSNGSQINVSLSANTALATPTGGATVECELWPLSLSWMTQVVQNQFSELTLSANSMVVFDVGVFCVFTPQFAPSSNIGMYYLQWNGTNIQIRRFVWNGNTTTLATATILSTIVATIAIGDVLRLEATNISGTWTLTAKKNGSVIGSTTDSTLIQGQPGWNVTNADGVVHTLALSEYAGGRL